MSAPLDHLDWRRRLGAAQPDPPLLRDVARLAMLAAAACLAIGSLIPWATGTDPRGLPTDYRATAGTGEGVVLIGAAVLLVLLARNRLVWESGSRTVQVLPILVVLFCAPMWAGVENYAGQWIEEWQVRGGTGSLTVARYLVLAGMGLLLIAFGWLEAKRGPEVRQRTRPLLAEWGITRWSAASILLALLLGGLGALVSVVAIVGLAGIEGVLPAVILGIFGLFSGIALGARLGRAIERRLG